MTTYNDISFKEMENNDLKNIDISDINELLFQLTGRKYSIAIDDLKELINRDEIFQFYAYLSENFSRVVGLLTLVIFYTPSGGHARIEDVVVDNEYRGKSIGRILTEKGIEKARELNITEIDLTSNPHRVAANQLYQKMGFEKRNTNVYRYKYEN